MAGSAGSVGSGWEGRSVPSGFPNVTCHSYASFTIRKVTTMTPAT